MKHPLPPPNRLDDAAIELAVARLRAMRNIQDASRILTEATRYVPPSDRHEWTSIAGGLNTLEQRIADLKSI